MTLQYGSGGDNRFGDHVGTIHGMTFFHGAARYLMDGRFECSDDQCGERTILQVHALWFVRVLFTVYDVCWLCFIKWRVRFLNGTYQLMTVTSRK